MNEIKNNIPMGVIGGLVAALIGGAIWAAVTVATNYQIGWMAIGVGFLVGLAVRILGAGDKPIFAIIGAVFALLGCVIGNIFSAFGFIAKEFDVKFFDILKEFDWSKTIELLKDTGSPMDLLFYGIALYVGFKFSKIEEGELGE